MQSLKSDALEPDLHNLPTGGFARFAALAFRSFSVYGLIFITLGLVVLFSVLLPKTSPSAIVSVALANNTSPSVIAPIALVVAVIVPIAPISIARFGRSRQQGER